MTAIDPFGDPFGDLRVPTGATGNAGARATPAPDDQFGKDTFLKLLVAQLKYQNPLQPSDSTEFLTQTAQFTMVERLQEIQDSAAESARANDVLAAASMIGRSATFNVGEADAAPVPTTRVTLGGALATTAAPGTKVSSTVDVYTATGAPVPLQLQLTRLPDTTAGHARWELRVLHGTTQVGNPREVTFDASGELTSGAVTIDAATLNQIAGTAGSWPVSGVTIANATRNDPDRLRVAEGGTTFSVREQNGGDGSTLTGVVTGILVDADNGVLVRIGEHAVKLQDIAAVTTVT